jgi:toxin ParE1/3/4
MSFRVDYLPESRDDIDDAFRHYRQISARLSEKFLRALRASIDRIVDNPELYAIVHRDVRAVLLRRFPYVVFYRIDEDRILIVAVQHGRRKWFVWQRRTF